MLLNCLDFWIHGGLIAANTCKTNLPSVSLESGIHQSISLTSDISGGLCVGEGLVSSSLVETCQISNCSGTSSSCCVSEKTEDRICDTGRVIEGQVGADTVEESVVGMFLWNFTAVKHGYWDGENVFGLWHRSCGGQAKQGNEERCSFVLHHVDQKASS